MTLSQETVLRVRVLDVLLKQLAALHIASRKDHEQSVEFLKSQFTTIVDASPETDEGKREVMEDARKVFDQIQPLVEQLQEGKTHGLTLTAWPFDSPK